jgi:alanine dehydrogenase
MSDAFSIEKGLASSDVVIGAVLVPGVRAPRLLSRAMLGLMRPASVIVDVAIDQGGCVETARPTTHAQPVHEVDGIVHYGVANMPGAVPVTSTRALTNATLPYVRRWRPGGGGRARADPGFASGLDVRAGEITYAPVLQAYADTRAAA